MAQEGVQEDKRWHRNLTKALEKSPRLQWK